MEDGTSIRVRIDNRGHTYITVVQWDENGREIVYRVRQGELPKQLSYEGHDAGAAHRCSEL